MQERNAEERKDIYPRVALRFHKRWREGNATQRIV
jgi:hypothetical protein